MSVQVATQADIPSSRAPAWSAVFALTLCVGTLIASEFMPVSLLTPIAAGLHITEGQAGQTIAVSGLFAVITSSDDFYANARDRSPGHPVGPDAVDGCLWPDRRVRAERSGIYGRSSAHRRRDRRLLVDVRRHGHALGSSGTGCTGSSAAQWRKCPGHHDRRAGGKLSRPVYRLARSFLLRGPARSAYSGLAIYNAAVDAVSARSRKRQRVQGASASAGPSRNARCHRLFHGPVRALHIPASVLGKRHRRRCVDTLCDPADRWRRRSRRNLPDRLPS